MAVVEILISEIKIFAYIAIDSEWISIMAPNVVWVFYEVQYNEDLGDVFPADLIAARNPRTCSSASLQHCGGTDKDCVLQKA